MQELYDWQLPGGPEVYENLVVPGMTAAWAQRLAERVGLRPGERVLDVACGTGAWARCAALRVGPAGRVTGLDITPAMLEVARRKGDLGPGAAAIDWLEGRADAIPLPDCSFDVVCCQLGLMFFPDRAAALREMRRVLAPGGRLVLMVWGRMERTPGQAAVAAAWARHLGDEAADGFRRQHSLSDPLEVHALIAGAGYRDITVQAAVGATRFPSAAHLVRGYGAMGGLQTTPAVAEALIGDVTEALKNYAGPDGVTYPVEAVVALARR